MSAFLSDKDFQRLGQIVREETGNQVQEKNHGMLESRLRGHMIKLGIRTTQEYWTHFEKNEAVEREALKALMTTHYTFFFREFVHFEVLEKWINIHLPELKRQYQNSNTPLRIWSAACSKGQEVYSLAMFLESILLKQHGIDFELVGTDIDHESVAYAKNGVYPIDEVNTIPAQYLNGNWKRGTGPVKDFAAIHPNLKKKIRFEVLNLFEVKKWNEANKFDVVFCRNVFIYFSEDNVKKIALSLMERVKEGGLFISGVSEPLRFPEWNFPNAGPSCYHKGPKARLEHKASPEKASLPLPSISDKVFEESGSSSSVYADFNSPSPQDNAASTYAVLCVDDSMTIQTLMKKIFSSDPHCKSIDMAFNGQDAKEKIAKKKYDLITLDIHMPIMTGVEFLTKAYNRQSDPPVIMVSSVNRSDVDLALKALSLGAADYVEKPAMNNLTKSIDEILTKAKMVMRNKNIQNTVAESSFTASLAQKIVVPDASQCSRIIVFSDDSVKQLEQIIKAQEQELRSPATLLINLGLNPIEGQILKWTARSVQTLREAHSFYKPNTLFVMSPDLCSEVFQKLSSPTNSLQILSNNTLDFGKLLHLPRLQILLDENVATLQESLESRNRFKVSDITPATSFASLSVEFFANIRKAAA